MEALHEFERDGPWDFAMDYEDSMNFSEFARKNEQWSRGYATEMLRQAIPIAAKIGIKRALVTCDVRNVASRKVI